MRKIAYLAILSVPLFFLGGCKESHQKKIEKGTHRS